MSKKDDIILAAIREFGEFGYDAASVNRIIKASKTSKGTFYHYFKDKKELYFTIAETSAEIKREYFMRLAADLKGGGDFFEALKARLKAGAVFMMENRDVYRFGVRFAREQGEAGSECYEKFVAETGNAFRKMIEAGITEGCFSKRYPADFIMRITYFLVMNYYEILFDRNETPEPGELEKKLETLFDFLRRGFG